jgi:hypothetical protein
MPHTCSRFRPAPAGVNVSCFVQYEKPATDSGVPHSPSQRVLSPQDTAQNGAPSFALLYRSHFQPLIISPFLVAECRYPQYTMLQLVSAQLAGGMFSFKMNIRAITQVQSAEQELFTVHFALVRYFVGCHYLTRACLRGS